MTKASNPEQRIHELECQKLVLEQFAEAALARIAELEAAMQQPVCAEEAENLVSMLVQAAREREAAGRLPDCIPGAQRRLDEARDKARAALLVSNRSGVERMREALKRLFEASKRHDPDDWDGEPAMVEAAQLLGESPFDEGGSRG